MSNQTTKANASIRTVLSIENLDVHQWNYLVEQIDDPVVARVIVQLFDEDKDIGQATKSAYYGIYVRATVTVQRDRIRYARTKERQESIAAFTRSIARSLRSLFSRSATRPVAEPMKPTQAQPTVATA